VEFASALWIVAFVAGLKPCWTGWIPYPMKQAKPTLNTSGARQFHAGSFDRARGQYTRIAEYGHFIEMYYVKEQVERV